MRYRLMASFQGATYQAGVGPSDEEVTLFAACPPPEELGFRSSSGHWRKRVSVEEIDALWESRPIGRYRGERCMLLDDLGDRVHIAYLGRDLYRARRLGFWEVDRGVFEVVVPRQEIQELREERGEYELAVLDEGSPPGSWDAGPRETWASNPRDYDDAPDTGPLRAVGAPRELVDTGPSWAPGARGPQARGGWDGGGWDLRDEQAQDPRDTGTWAAVRDVDPRDQADGPFPRGRGGWRARDTGGWEAPDTGAWDAREVAERAAREAGNARGAARNSGSWNAADVAAAADRNSGSWNAADARAAAADRNSGGWSAADTRAADAQAAGRNTGGWSAADARSAGRGTGGWSAAEIADAAARDLQSARDLRDTGDTRDTADRWDMREAAPPGQREVERWEPAPRWDPQDTVAWNPQSSGEWDAPVVPWDQRPARPMHARPAELDPRDAADWEPNEVVRPASHQRTPDAAAVWHGSPTPQDSGRWSTPASANGYGGNGTSGYSSDAYSGNGANGYGAPARLAIGGGLPDPAASGRANGSPPFSHRKNGYQDPALTREPAAVNGAAAPDATSAAGVPGHAGRHSGRRSGRRARVTAQSVFSQLLDQASIPQSSYAVDAEVDGAMCLVHTRGGYEVFSSADRTRHEVRFFEDEEAAYFYLFGILAAEAIRSGHLGPQTAPPGHRSRSAQPGYPASGR
jgi:hypothetical protein